MKKLFALMMVAGFAVAIVACGGKTETAESAVDTSAVEAAPVDTTATDTTATDTTAAQ
jgi:PBP1b-binding outer membrane lipoprotein LpoB